MRLPKIVDLAVFLSAYSTSTSIEGSDDLVALYDVGSSHGLHRGCRRYMINRGSDDGLGSVMALSEHALGIS